MRKGNEPFAQWVKHLESKAKLIPHTDFMIAPKTSEKEKNFFMVQLFGIVIHGVKSTKEGTQMK